MGNKRRWRIAILLGAGVLVNYFDRVNLSVAHEALHSEFDLSNEGFGYLLSAYSWTYAALQLPVGAILDKFGVRLIGRISAFLWCAASFWASLAGSIASFFGARLLLGVGEAPTFPANAKAIGRWFPSDERSFSTSIFDAAAKFASGIGVPLIGLVLIHFGWRTSFAVTGIVSFLYFLAFYFVYREPEQDPKLTASELAHIQSGQTHDAAESEESQLSLAYLLSQPKVVGLALGFGAYNYCFYLFLTWLPSYFSALHMNLSHSILFTSVPWLFGALTDLAIGGWLVDSLIRKGYDSSKVRKSVLVGGTVLGLAIAGAMFTQNAFWAAFWISLSLGGLSAAAPVGWSIPGLLVSKNSVGKVGGIVNFANQISAIVAPIATAKFAGPENSFSRAFAAAAVVLAAGIASYIFLLGRIEPIAQPARHQA